MTAPDPGHLLPAADWAAVVADAERQAQRIAAGQAPAEAPRGYGTGALPLSGTVTAPSNGGRRAGGAPTFGVIHTAETPLTAGYAAAIARYFAGGPGTSCHYMTDPGETWGVLDDGAVAWHCGTGNTNSVALEQAGRASMTRAQWLAPAGRAQMRRNAEVIRACQARYGIGAYMMTDAQLLAAHRRQIVGGWATHDQCRRVLGGTSHTDPGAFPTDVQMQLANDTTTPEEISMADAASLQAQLNDTNKMVGALYAVTISKTKGADGELLDRVRNTDVGVAAILAAVSALKPGTVSAADIAAALPDALARQVADEIAKRLAS